MSSDGLFMSIVAALGSASKSFEEVRVDDYLLSYRNSGRPPPPVPQEPTNEIQRKALGLPPLFKPQTEITPATNELPGTSSSALVRTVASGSLITSPSQSTTTTTAVTKPKIVNSANIPIGQEFKLHTIATEKYHNIVCMPEYEGFCPEELRYYAYFRGNITSPVPIAMDPFVTPTKEPPTTINPAVDELQSQCALPEYNRHSAEELRVAWMMSGREMTSNDLLGPAVPSLPPAPSLGGTSGAPTTSVPPPVIAAAAPTAPKFNFVFR